MKIETLEVAGFKPALHGMRNPKDSWAKSDTTGFGHVCIGRADMELAQSLIKGGPCHSKFLRQIIVWADVVAPLYWFTEFDTYKVGVVRNSCSTMHTLLKKLKTIGPELDDSRYYELFEVPVLEPIKHTIQKSWTDMYHLATSEYLDESEKIRAVKQILPDSFLQRSTITLSYENIRNILQWRSSHRLPEWNTVFVKWCRSLPYHEQFLFYENGVTK